VYRAKHIRVTARASSHMQHSQVRSSTNVLNPAFVCQQNTAAIPSACLAQLAAANAHDDTTIPAHYGFTCVMLLQLPAVLVKSTTALTCCRSIIILLLCVMHCRCVAFTHDGSCGILKAATGPTKKRCVYMNTTSSSKAATQPRICVGL
jgi:hypothetical protein